MEYIISERNVIMPVIPEKKAFLEELEKIPNDDTRKKLIDLFDHLKGYKKLNGNTVRKMIKDVLYDLFGCSQYTTDILIPYKFLDSNVGKVVFSIKYGMEENTYTISEFIEFTKTPEKPEGLTRQYLGQEIKRGRLKAEVRNGRYEISESNANEYLIQKGYPPIE